MKLRAMANRLTRAVNPNVAGTVKMCVGYQNNAAGKREPIYGDATPITLQPQALSKREVEHLDALNISNATRAVYADTPLTPADRKAQSGGDLLRFAEPDTGAENVWLVVALLEGWPGSLWCKAALAKQIDA